MSEHDDNMVAIAALTSRALRLEAERDRLREAAENWLKEYRRFDESAREYDADKRLREALRVTEQETP